MLINIDYLARLTGSTRRTVTKKVQDLPKTQGKGREQLVESVDALPLVLDVRQSPSNSMLEVKTRLTMAQAEKAEIELEVVKGTLIPSDIVETTVNDMVSAFRSRMLGLPTRAAPTAVQSADAAECENFLRDLVYEALQELSEYDPEKYRIRDDKKGSEVSSSATETNDKPVGGRKKKAVKRGVKRTRPVEN